MARDDTGKSASTDGGRIPSLDGARGIAILLVLLHHAGQRWTMPRLVRPVVDGGWSGVDLFFVLSGFLITGLLLRGRGAPRGLAKFWVRRALRIFPPAYAALAVCYALSLRHAHGFPVQPAETWAWFALYGGNIHVLLHGWPTIEAVAVTWSLAIEEQFYFVWPLVARFAPRWAVMLVALALVVIAPLVRVWLWPQYQGLSSAFTLGRCDGLAMGALLALAFERPALRASSAGVASLLAAPGVAIAIALAVGPLDQPAWFAPYRYGVIALAYVPLVALAAAPGPRLGRLLRVRWLRWIGERSYGVYLVHFIVAPAYESWTAEWLDRGVGSALGWVLTVLAVAALSFRYFERPILSLREGIETRLGLRGRFSAR